MWDIANGFVPRTFDEILATMTAKINEQYGTNYDVTTIQGTNFYKYFYAGIQVIMEAEQQVADLSGKYQQYIASTNQRILQPRGTADGFINFIANDGVLNTEGSFDPIDEPSKAGKIKFAILLDKNDEQYNIKKAKLIEYFHKYLSVGLYYYGGIGDAYQGEWNAETTYPEGVLVLSGSKYYNSLAENTNVNPAGNPEVWEESVAPANFVTGDYNAINGQEFHYAFYLPRYYRLTSLTITLPISANNNNYVMTQKEVQDLFAQKFQEYMTLGKNLEPESICSIKEFNFASRVVYSGSYQDDTGAIHNFSNTPEKIPFDVKFRMMDASNIVVIYQ